MRCPGQDVRYWKPDDVFEVPCPSCGASVEFFKDDAWRKCFKCGRTFSNPRLDLGCAEWCPHAEQCLGQRPSAAGGGDGRGDPTDRG